MCQQSHNKYAEATYWLQKHVCILWEFSIFLGDSNLHHFAIEAGPTQALHA